VLYWVLRIERTEDIAVHN